MRAHRLTLNIKCALLPARSAQQPAGHQTFLSTQKLVAEAISLFTECMQMIRTFSLFSANETVEDRSANDLQWEFSTYFRCSDLSIHSSNPSCPTYHIRLLLVDAYLGDLVVKVIDGDRLKNLERAKVEVSSESPSRQANLSPTMSFFKAHWTTFLTTLDNYELLDSEVGLLPSVPSALASF